MTLRLFFNLLLTEVEHKNEISHSVFAWLKLTIKIPKQCVKLFQIKKKHMKEIVDVILMVLFCHIALVFPLLNLNK